MRKICFLLTLTLIATKLVCAEYPSSSYNIASVINSDGTTVRTLTKWTGVEKKINMTLDCSLTVVDKIGPYAFKDNLNLQEIVLGEFTKEIDLGAFQGCSNLAIIGFTPSVRHIWQNAFRDCSNLTAITFGPNIQTVGKEAFFNCNRIATFSVDEQNKFYKSLDGILYTHDETILVKYPAAKQDTEYVIANTVTTIADGALDGCDKLVSLTFGPNVSKIGNYVTERCWGLNVINCYAINPPTLGVNTIFPPLKEKLILHVPVGKKAYYEQSNWSNVYKIIIDDLVITSGMENNFMSLKVTTDSKKIYVENAKFGEVIEIFNFNGNLIYKDIARSNQITIPVFNSGIYLMRYSKKTFKVLVK